ncbi:MAG: hypothetical protein M3Y81_11390 [Chloroflexota bacterium]|nr:hypothetical protein [Chloroflexota bacterium]
MAEQQSTVIVGVFEDHAKAQQAYDELRSTGFGHDYLGITQPGSTAKLLDLESSGVPGEQADYYEHEHSSGRTLITVRAGGLQPDSVQKAHTILRKHGAYDASSGREQAGHLTSNINTDTPTPYFDLKPDSK